MKAKPLNDDYLIGKKAGQEDIIKRIAAGEAILIDSQNVQYFQLKDEEWQKTAKTISEEAKKAGIKEVVEWVKNGSFDSCVENNERFYIYRVYSSLLQAQLRKWGL